MENSNFFTAQLCGCNNCNTVMVDKNPDDQPELPTDNISDLKDMEWMGVEAFWACPECKTDEYLVDINSIEELHRFTDEA